MKPIISISLLSLVVAGIVVLWLIPGVNTAKETTYVRRYEDTDALSKEVTASDTTRSKKSVAEKQEKKEQKTEKKYKTEKISSKDSPKKLKMSMFSRAIQFERELADSKSVVAVHDSVMIKADTTSVAKRNP